MAARERSDTGGGHGIANPLRGRGCIPRKRRRRNRMDPRHFPLPDKKQIGAQTIGHRPDFCPRTNPFMAQFPAARHPGHPAREIRRMPEEQVIAVTQRKGERHEPEQRALQTHYFAAVAGRWELL